MTYKQYRDVLECDYQRYKGSGSLSKIMMYIKTPGYKINVWKRRCELLEQKKMLKLLYVMVRLKYRHLCIKYGIDIPSHVHLGKGFCIFHFGGIIISSFAKIGENVTVRPNVVIGGTENGAPIIGDDVKIGVNACVIGPIIVGKHVEIGAGAVVVKDIPDNVVAAGNPAKILRMKKIIMGEKDD